MMTWLPEDNILFTCDLLGSHFCDTRMYNDLVSRDFWPDFKYYFDCIMRPYKKNIRNAISKVEELEIELVAPSHGPILREDISKYLKAYEKWAEPKAPNNPPKLLIYFAAAHGNTGIMAQKIAEGASSTGVEVQVFDATDINPDEHIARIEEADALLLGSPTINNNAVKPVWDVLNALITIDVKGKVAGSFGSYGWSGDAVEQLDSRLQAMKFKVPEEGVKAILVPSEQELQACFDFGATIAANLKN
jgi:flavorubredoxin